MGGYGRAAAQRLARSAYVRRPAGCAGNARRGHGRGSAGALISLCPCAAASKRRPHRSSLALKREWGGRRSAQLAKRLRGNQRQGRRLRACIRIPTSPSARSKRPALRLSDRRGLFYSIEPLCICDTTDTPHCCLCYIHWCAYVTSTVTVEREQPWDMLFYD